MDLRVTLEQISNTTKIDVSPILVCCLPIFFGLKDLSFFLLMSPRPHCRSLTLFFKTQRSIVCACANVFMAGQEAFSQAFRAKSSQQNFKQPHMLVRSVVSKSYTFFFF